MAGAEAGWSEAGTEVLGPLIDHRLMPEDLIQPARIAVL
jgi:hypothetical protein